jgi:hypothetical protein
MAGQRGSPVIVFGARRLVRIVLTGFVLTFACARILVLLIMSRDLPDLYLHLGGTHVHHLNIGIFLLAALGAWLLFARPAPGRRLDLLAALYGVGLALTFDEFGMWLHLGGGYWQRASFDAVTAIAGALALAAFAPPWREWTPRRALWAACVVALLSVFFWRLSLSLSTLGPRLQHIEHEGPN